MRIWSKAVGFGLMLVSVAQAADISLGRVPVSVEVTAADRITVENPNGAWYDQLALSKSGAILGPEHSVQVPVRVTLLRAEQFQVSLVDPLLLSHTSKPGLNFTTREVAFGPTATALRPLTTVIPQAFTNVDKVGNSFTGDYLLSIKADEPAGNREDNLGHYRGKLTMLFELKL